MKIRNIVNKVKTLPKSIMALLIIALFSIPLVAGFASAANQVLMEGNTTALNVTAGQTTYSDNTTLKVDEVAQVQVWHHNRELPTGEKANNTVVKVNVPTTPGKSQIITGSTTSDNGNAISDTTLINLSLDQARLEYIPGTAKFKYNKGATQGDVSCQTGLAFPAERCFATVVISDSVVTTGVNLDAVRGGPLNGCNAYHETVTVQVRSKASVVSVNKYVRHLGQTAADWKTTTTAKPGDDLEYLIKFKNEGNTQINSVMVGDNLPMYNKYVASTTKLQNGISPTGTAVASDNVTTGGINTGNYLPGAAGYVWFKVKIDPVSAFPKCGDYDIRNVGVVRPAGMNEFFNTAQVIIKVECAPVVPVASCDSLKAVKTTGFGVKFTAAATATNGATISKYNYAFGDGQTQSITANTVDHSYATFGTYTATVTVDFLVNGQTVSKTSPACKVTVTFDKAVVPVYTCDSLKAEKIGDRKVKFTGAATAAGGATIQSYNYDFGDTNKTTTNATTVEHTYAKDGTYTIQLTVEFLVNGQKVTANGPQCKVTVKFDKPDEPKPVYTCDSLKAEKLGGRTVKFTANATATNGATISKYIYNFGDSTTQTSTENMINYTYDKDGEYTASVTVEFLVNGQKVTANGPQCKVTVKFDKPDEPKKPIYTCDLLSVQKTGGRTVKFTANATATNGAEIKRYIFSFGDGGEQTTDKNMVEHTYAKDGQYVARVKVQFAVKNETVTAESEKCAVVVEFTTPVTPETPKTPTTPTVLPDTGAGSIAAAFAAASGLGSLGFSLITRRRKV